MVVLLSKNTSLAVCPGKLEIWRMDTQKLCNIFFSALLDPDAIARYERPHHCMIFWLSCGRIPIPTNFFTSIRFDFFICFLIY